VWDQCHQRNNAVLVEFSAKEIMMKRLAILLIVICVGVSGCTDSAQPSPEELEILKELAEGIQQAQFSATLLMGMVLYPTFFLEDAGASREQIDEVNEKQQIIFDELHERTPLLENSTPAQKIERWMAMLPQRNEAMRNVWKESFSEEVVKQIDTLIFQNFGGVFGGALNVNILATLELTDEQYEKVAAIIEELNRERFELHFSRKKLNVPVDFDKMKDNKGWKEFNDNWKEIKENLENMKEVNEKMVTLTRRGQKEIEALLTDEQKKRAEELMADVPEKYRFMKNYLEKHP
jgi:Spy/CpxP family protein refolding chaperone